MQVFRVRGFIKFQRRERIDNQTLSRAAKNLEDGLVDADLAGGVFKQRVARKGQGKSGGYRVIVAFRQGHRAVFLLGFAKNERANIDADEQRELREQGRALLDLTAKQIETLVELEELEKVGYDETR